MTLCDSAIAQMNSGRVSKQAFGLASGMLNQRGVRGYGLRW